MQIGREQTGFLTLILDPSKTGKCDKISRSRRRRKRRVFGRERDIKYAISGGFL